MASRIQQIIPADGWYAVFARPSGATREHTSHSAPRLSVAGGMYRTGAPIPEFLPLVAWALLSDDADNQAASRIVGVVVDEDHRPKRCYCRTTPAFWGTQGQAIPGLTVSGSHPIGVHSPNRHSPNSSRCSTQPNAGNDAPERLGNGSETSWERSTLRLKCREVVCPMSRHVATALRSPGPPAGLRRRSPVALSRPVLQITAGTCACGRVPLWQFGIGERVGIRVQLRLGRVVAHRLDDLVELISKRHTQPM